MEFSGGNRKDPFFSFLVYIIFFLCLRCISQASEVWRTPRFQGHIRFMELLCGLEGGLGRGYGPWHLRIIMLGRFFFSFVSCDLISLVE